MNYFQLNGDFIRNCFICNMYKPIDKVYEIRKDKEKMYMCLECMVLLKESEKHKCFCQICFVCAQFKKSYKCLKLWQMNNFGDYILDTELKRVIGYMCLNCSKQIKENRKGKCLFCDTIDEGVCQNCKDRYYVKII